VLQMFFISLWIDYAEKGVFCFPTYQRRVIPPLNSESKISKTYNFRPKGLFPINYILTLIKKLRTLETSIYNPKGQCFGGLLTYGMSNMISPNR